MSKHRVTYETVSKQIQFLTRAGPKASLQARKDVDTLASIFKQCKKSIERLLTLPQIAALMLTVAAKHCEDKDELMFELNEHIKWGILEPHEEKSYRDLWHSIDGLHPAEVMYLLDLVAIGDIKLFRAQDIRG